MVDLVEDGDGVMIFSSSKGGFFFYIVFFWWEWYTVVREESYKYFSFSK